MENVISVEKPILPVAADVLPYGTEFADKTIYKESYLPSDVERVVPIVPCGSISIPDAKMSADTTTKVQFHN